MADAWAAWSAPGAHDACFDCTTTFFFSDSSGLSHAHREHGDPVAQAAGARARWTGDAMADCADGSHEPAYRDELVLGPITVLDNEDEIALDAQLAESMELPLRACDRAWPGMLVTYKG